MKKRTAPFILFLLVAFSFNVHSQENDLTPLFANQDPLEVKLSYAFQSVQKNTSDTVYLPTFLHYKMDNMEWDSVKINLRGRGNFRREKCFFSPIRIKIDKKDSKGTLFTGNKNLKLVLPCQVAKASDELVIKEFLCYKLYESITPYVFHTRLINLSLTNENEKKPKLYEVKAFLIEDDGLVAKRYDAKMVKGKVNALALQDTASTMHDFFQFMIANTDWSIYAQHNVKVMYLPNKDFVPLAYDFDMSGIVNAPYSQVSEKLEIKNVRDRLYRGICKDEGLVQYVRSEYIKLEPKLWKNLEDLQSELSTSEYSGIRRYMEEFFAIMKDDRRFNDSILKACRSTT